MRGQLIEPELEADDLRAVEGPGPKGVRGREGPRPGGLYWGGRKVRVQGPRDERQEAQASAAWRTQRIQPGKRCSGFIFGLGPKPVARRPSEARATQTATRRGQSLVPFFAAYF